MLTDILKISIKIPSKKKTTNVFDQSLHIKILAALKMLCTHCEKNTLFSKDTEQKVNPNYGYIVPKKNVLMTSVLQGEVAAWAGLAGSR